MRTVVLATAVAGCNASVGEPKLAQTEVDAGAAGDALDELSMPDGGDDGLADAAAPPCVEGDARVEDPETGACYMIFHEPKTWPDARTACEAIGAGVHLATSADQAENDRFSPLAGLGDVWIGGNDLDVEDQWVWNTGEPMLYTNWRNGEPNDGTEDGEDCMIIEGDNGGLWDDRNCELKTFPYLCERDGTSS